MIDTQRCKLRDTSSARILYLSYILIVFPRIYLVCTYEVFCNCRVTVWQLFSFLYEVFFSCVFKLVCLHLIGWYGVVLTAAVYFVCICLFLCSCVFSSLLLLLLSLLTYAGAGRGSHVLGIGS